MALVVAVVLGVLSIVLIRRYVENLEAKYRFEVLPQPYLVAARDIAPGTVIGENDIDTAEFPGNPTNRALGSAKVENKQTIVGARLVSEIKAGQIFTRLHFPDLGTGARKNDLKGKFTNQYRAFTLPIDETRGVAGMLRPGDYVDLAATIQFTDQTGTSTTATRTILKNAYVLATNDKTSAEDVRPGERYGSLTLRLTPRDCNRLLFVTAKGGTLQCLYVQPNSPEEAGWNTVTAETLYDEIARELDEVRGRSGG